ncbi:MAG: chloride channel protein, partial [Ectothiorhodospiraceae bacterium]
MSENQAASNADASVESTADAASRTEEPLSTHTMFILALLVGIFGGFGSIVFKSVIAFLHNVFFYGELGLIYDPDAHIAPSPLGAAIILVPVLGAVLVTWITKTLAPEARGHGVPEVLNAIYYQKGHIRPVVVLAKALASAISIGTGGSVGREGPIIQIGSAFGSTLGQIIRMPTRQRIVLVCAGAGAGIAATFNAPIGGLAFAMELLLVSISARTVALVAISTVTATYIGRLYSGLNPSFNVPEIAHFEGHLVSLYAFILCIPFGVLMGLASGGFIRGLYWMEDLFEKTIRNDYLRHMAGMFCVGVLIYLFLLKTGHYYVAGVGYATIIDILKGLLSDPLFLLLLFAAKLLATGLTLGSGASGGIFSPSLFLGATLGSAFGNAIALAFPQAQVEPVVFAIAGMAGMVSGTTGAVVTAITMTLEQTRDYSAMIPIITTVALAYVVRGWVTPESIYTLKLARRGAAVPQGLQAAVSSSHNARTVMSKNFQVIDISELEEWQAKYRPGEGPRYTLISREGEVLGIARPELMYLLRDKNPEAVIDKNFFVVASNTPWPVIMRGLR